MNLKYCMSYDEAQDTIKALYDLIPVINNFPVSVQIKAQHKAKVTELKELYEKCASVHNVYDPEYSSEFNRYKTMAWIDYKTTSKAKLDNTLHYIKEYLLKDVQQHIYELRKLQAEWLEQKVV